MVCPRCITSVEQILKNNNLQPNYVRLGEVDISKAPGEKKLKKIADDLRKTGFELLNDSKQQVIEKIKNIVIAQIHQREQDNRYNFSKVLSESLHKDYSYLSNLFSEVEGITIEKYIINHKIEKAKELIIYDELNISEIAFTLGYSSVAHLSNQFKKVTGLTPSHFKKIGQNKRRSLDAL